MSFRCIKVFKLEETISRFQIDLSYSLTNLEKHKKHVEEKFFEMNEKLNEPQQKLKEMEERITNRFQTIIDHLLTRLDTHENRVGEEFRRVDDRLLEPAIKLKETEERVTGLFQSILARFQSRLDNNENSIEEKFNQIEIRIQGPENRLTKAEGRIRQLEIEFEQEKNNTANQVAVVPPVIFLQPEQDNTNLTQTACPDRSPALPRTCFDLRKADSKLPSGLYWIDPDGEKIGEQPIQVFCNMTSGKFIKFSFYCLFIF